MSNSSFEVGCSFRLDGRPYRVRDASKRNCVLEDLKDGELESKSRADLGRAYANGTLIFEDLLRPLADTEYSMRKRAVIPPLRSTAQAATMVSTKRDRWTP